MAALKKVSPLQRVKNVAKKVCEKKATRAQLKAAENAAIRHAKAVAKKAEREAIAKAKKAAKEAEKKIRAASKKACRTRTKKATPITTALNGVRKRRKPATRKKSTLKLKRRRKSA